MICQLPNRGMLRIGGDDRRSFLQGLISNDINLCVGDVMLYAALLTPQGKFLHDMFIADTGDSFLIDCEGGARADDLLRRLQAYKLRAKVTFENVSDAFDVWVGWSEEQGFLTASSSRKRGSILSEPLQKMDARLREHDAIFYADPRLSALGTRIIMPKGQKPEGETTDFTAYDKHRLSLGVPDGSRDMIVEKSTLLESNIDQLNGISWSKGCYMGQELTARTHYRALVKKRLFPVKIEGPAPAFGSIIKSGDEDIGEMRSSCEDVGLAMLGVEQATTNTRFICSDAKLAAYQPD